MDALNYPDYFYPNGSSKRHFFSDGDLLIRANDGLFLVHRNIVCPVIQHVSDAVSSVADGETHKPVVLDTSPCFLELLLQVIYEKPWFCPSSLKHCLVLFAASRVYRAPFISVLCKNYLLEHLPVSFKDIDVVEQYRESAQITITVLSLCTSFRINPPLPWVFYAFYTHLARPQASSDLNLITPTMRELAKLHKKNINAIYTVAVSVVASWNERAAAFYEGNCVQEWNFMDECLRRNEGRRPKSCMLATSDVNDPMKGMLEMLGMCEVERLCCPCKEVLRNDMIEFMRIIYASICSAIGLSEPK